MPKKLITLRQIPRESYEAFSTSTINTTTVLLDAHCKELHYLDRVLFSPSKGRFVYGVYLGSSESGKSAKCIFFYANTKINPRLYLATNGSQNLLKIDWSDDTCPHIEPELTKLLQQLEADLEVIDI